MTGRWPANVILSPGTAEVLDGQSGVIVDRNSGKGDGFRTHYVNGEARGKESSTVYRGQGGASRFFLNAGYEPWELEWIYSVGLRPCGTEEA